jgi:hypothetical protein
MRWLLWALFGNDDDGAWGQRSGEPGYDGKPFSVWLAVCWWFRNPAHNLFFHVLRWPGGPFLSVKGCFYIGFRPNTDPRRDGVFGAALFRGYP